MSSIYIDLIIIILLIFGFFIGFRRGFTRQLVALLGMVLVLIISYILKKPLAIFMYKNLPFFKFNGLSSLNILLYEVIAFFLVFSILNIVLKILIVLTNIFEKFLKATILLSIPSKLLGGVLGLIENYVIVFIILYVLSLPNFNININSKISNIILNNTPILSNKCAKNLKSFEQIEKLKKDYQSLDNLQGLNEDIINIFTKYGIASEKSIKTLKKQNKL